MKENEKTFEEAISELEEVVKKLENGDLPLDESIELFQKGLELSRCCSKKLDEVEKKISRLIESEDGDIIETAFDPAGAAED
ncbi:MAG: exodeoxyribonuclease VII small subunit [Clostridiales bacterium]|jgi:exodeoxyribonuclease VII small subunit|nr:exodeoxyribonuclease VII small subunit [Eubacteriales bacterium]MDH7565229.1 exodeoxyribonuclease VII small subunit [Clostridiales bacterium]